MISRLDTRNADDLELAKSALKIILWSENDDRVIQAYACDTQTEVNEMAERMEEFGDVFHTKEYTA